MKTFVSIFILIFSHQVYSEELYEPYASVRALGMGNAFISVVRDDNALFYNPAALSFVEGYQLKILNLRGGLGASEPTTLIENISNIQSSSGSGFADTINTFLGQQIWLGGGGRASITIPGFSLMYFGALDGSAKINNPAFTNLNVNYTFDTGFAFGYAMDLVPEVFSWGLAMKKVTRVGGRIPIGVSTLSALSTEGVQSQLANTGVGYSVDTGIMIRVPSPIKPVVSLVWKNVGNTTYHLTTGSTRPPTDEREVSLGFAMEYEKLSFALRPALDFKHLLKTEESLGKKIHMGLELGFPFMDIRAGLHQGYYTLGMGLDLSLFQLDLATYGVELGEYPGQHEDRRFSLEFNMQLSFDPDFNFKGFGAGSSRGLKQRR